MINRVVLSGRLTSDPELRQTSDGKPVINFSIAVERPYHNKEWGKKTADFFTIIAWQKLAEICEKYLHKGMMVAVDGHLQCRKFEKDGVVKNFTDVVAENVQFLSKMENKEEDIPM